MTLAVMDPVSLLRAQAWYDGLTLLPSSSRRQCDPWLLLRGSKGREAGDRELEAAAARASLHTPLMTDWLGGGVPPPSCQWRASPHSIFHNFCEYPSSLTSSTTSTRQIPQLKAPETKGNQELSYFHCKSKNLVHKAPSSVGVPGLLER